MELYPCSFECPKSVAVMVCVWLQPFLFFISRTVFFSLHRIFNTFSQKDVLFTVFGFLEYFFNFSIVVLLTKLNPVVVCWKPWPFSWIFVVKTALIWLVLVGFFCVFSQSESICNLHSCYKFALVLHILHSCYRRAALLSQPIRIE